MVGLALPGLDLLGGGQLGKKFRLHRRRFSRSKMELGRHPGRPIDAKPHPHGLQAPRQHMPGIPAQGNLQRKIRLPLVVACRIDL
jgi:hypothetical protein